MLPEADKDASHEIRQSEAFRNAVKERLREYEFPGTGVSGANGVTHPRTVGGVGVLFSDLPPPRLGITSRGRTFLLSVRLLKEEGDRPP